MRNYFAAVKIATVRYELSVRSNFLSQNANTELLSTVLWAPRNQCARILATSTFVVFFGIKTDNLCGELLYFWSPVDFWRTRRLPLNASNRLKLQPETKDEKRFRYPRHASRPAWLAASRPTWLAASMYIEAASPGTGRRWAVTQTNQNVCRLWYLRPITMSCCMRYQSGDVPYSYTCQSGVVGNYFQYILVI